MFSKFDYLQLYQVTTQPRTTCMQSAPKQTNSQERRGLARQKIPLMEPPVATLRSTKPSIRAILCDHVADPRLPGIRQTKLLAACAHSRSPDCTRSDQNAECSILQVEHLLGPFPVHGLACMLAYLHAPKSDMGKKKNKESAAMPGVVALGEALDSAHREPVHLLALQVVLPSCSADQR